jgi:hypothetical protein
MVKSVWFCVFQVNLQARLHQTWKKLTYINDSLPLQESPYKLDVIARDFQDASIVSVDFLSAEGKTSFVAMDTSGNMRVLEWDPERE